MFLCLLGVCFLLFSIPVNAATNPTATGESGLNGSGGGGGKTGGVAGEAVLHYHDDSCYKNISVPLKYKSNYYEDDDENDIHHKEYYTDYIDIQGATSVVINVIMERRTGRGTHNDGEGVILYNQNGGVIWSANQDTVARDVRNQWDTAGYGNTWEKCDYSYEAHDDYDDDLEYNGATFRFLHYDENGHATRYRYDDEDGDWQSWWQSANASSCFVPSSEKHASRWWGSTTYRYKYIINIPNNTTKIKFQAYINAGDNFDLPQISASVTLNHVKSCAYYDGEVVRSKASLGGTSDVSIKDIITNSNINVNQSTQTGNGTFTLKVVNGNILNGQNNIAYLNNIPLRDTAIPNNIQNITINENAIRKVITWSAPESNGIEYELKAQTYKINYNNPNGTELIMDTELN